jgi:hypothetical protein
MDRSQQEFQRATRITAAASMGSMLVISAFAAGISNAAASGGAHSSLPVAPTRTEPPTVKVAKAVVQFAGSSSVSAAVPTCANHVVVRPGDSCPTVLPATAATVKLATKATVSATATTKKVAPNKVTTKKVATKKVVVTTPVTAATTTRASH